MILSLDSVSVPLDTFFVVIWVSSKEVHNIHEKHVRAFLFMFALMCHGLRLVYKIEVHTASNRHNGGCTHDVMPLIHTSLEAILACHPALSTK